MHRCSREITKEQYDRAIENNGYLKGIDKQDVFTEAERWGYGVYAARVYEKNGKYMVGFSLGDTCD